MGMRKYLRQIAKNRLAAVGLENVNRKMSIQKDGVANWRRALYGESGEKARAAQMKAGRQAAALRRKASA